MLVNIQTQNNLSQKPPKPSKIEKQKSKKNTTQLSNGFTLSDQNSNDAFSNGVANTSSNTTHAKTKKTKSKKRKAIEHLEIETQADKNITKGITLNKSKIEKVNEEIKRGIDVGDSSEDEFRVSDMEECIEVSDSGKAESLDNEEMAESLEHEEMEDSDDEEVIEKTLDYNSDGKNILIIQSFLFYLSHSFASYLLFHLISFQTRMLL